MSFNANIPQPTDRLSKSQQDLLNNNIASNNSFGVNHYPFNNLTAFNGMHKYAQFVNQSVIPPGLINGAETLYANDTTGIGELYFTRGNSGVEIQMTNGNVSVNAGGNGYTFLPGGFILQFGNDTCSGTGVRSVTFVANGNITFPNNIFAVVGQPNIGVVGNGTEYTVASKTTAGFVFVSNPTRIPSGTVFTWFAIGN